MKKIAFALLGVVIAVVIAIAALLALVDPNQFKPMIAEQVKKATGRDLVIEGDIGWRFFPSLGFDIGQTAFRNPQGFAEPNLVQFDNAELSVSVMPLFSRELHVGKVSLQGGRIFVQTLPSGVSNLDGLGKQAGDSTGEQQPADIAKKTDSQQPESSAPAQPWAMSLDGIEIVDASAVIRDDRNGNKTDISQFDFSLSRFAPGEWTEAKFDINGQADKMVFAAKGQTQLLINKKLDGAELKQLALDLSANDGNTEIKSASLSLDSFKLGEWSTIEFSAKGQLPELAFDSKGKTRLNVSPDVKMVSLDGLSLDAALSGSALPRPSMKVSVKADATYDIPAALATVSAFATSADELAVSGSMSFKSADIPVIRFDLASDRIDVDAFMGKDEQPAPKSGSESTASTKAEGSDPSVAVEEQEPDLSVFKTVDVAGKVAIGELKAANAKLSNVVLSVTVKDGVLKLKGLDADLYKGHLNASATIDARGALPTYRVSKHLNGVQIQPMLVDIAGNDVLAGTGSIDIALSGKGLTESRIRKNVNGTIAVNFADGAVYGVNIPEMIREAKATLKGHKAEYIKEEKKTDFSSMKATMKLGNGIASTSDLDINSPLLRIGGQGETNLVSEKLAFLINTSVVATSKGQGGKEIDEVADLTVPINVTGNWNEPKFALNIAQLLKQNNELEEKAQREVERGLKKLFGDKADDENIKNAADKLLKGLFN
ncbi:cell envelope biogenesis protein AsmA [Photobacterium aquae]|uniref:Cell envelope biogenesis protein AsmA n=1 Tax=Photobacterium aquae TaxID=1195763 RepID=A0A0J1HBG8_9GAMM|nr:AsmA family protein [Photobacterium aquae]KLV08995.1 cell envelope biogenesis protein AsmA [Photobacterium aquae]